MDNNIVIGRHGFNRQVLEECKTLKAAKETFSLFPEPIVKKAFYQVHPKKKRTPKED